MKHPERVEDYLGHIAEAITRATSYVESSEGIEAFRQNPLVQDGVVRNIEIIGEAANHINRMPRTSSRSIRSFRGRRCEACATLWLTPISTSIW
jgi:uncharacterized protein with HEPN domain